MPVTYAQPQHQTVTSPVSFTTPDSTLSLSQSVHQGKADSEDVEAAYGHKRDTLLKAADRASHHLVAIESFAKDDWQIRYPSQLGVPTPNPNNPRPARGGFSRSQTGYFGPHDSAVSLSDVLDNASASTRPTHGRSFSTIGEGEAPPTSGANEDDEIKHPLSILSLDARPHSSTPSVSALVPNLGAKTLNRLLLQRFSSSHAHLQQVRSRTADTSSRILVSGDVNAGKSTFSNAVLRKPGLLPTDQQPMTEVFTEVIDAAENGGKEEIHAITKEVAEKGGYKNGEEGTYDRYEVGDLQEIVTRGDDYAIVKVYIDDVSGGSSSESDSNGNGAANESLLRNGMVSISLIDGPGLNRDTLSTTAVFARETEIDVIVFVVSAENHFTLSAKEFLFNASREKAYVFIVVNKWAGIRDKTRCARLVGEQIKQLSPATWENRNELVHYVDSEGAWTNCDEGDKESVNVTDPAFQHLESSLRSFVLRKRERSKLAPAKHYMNNLLTDLLTLSEYNLRVASEEFAAIEKKLEVLAPAHDKLVRQRGRIEEAIEEEEEGATGRIMNETYRRAERALKYIGNGQVVPPTFTEDGHLASTPSGSSIGISAPTSLPPYEGLFNIFSWAESIRSTFLTSLEAELRSAEESARAETKKSVGVVMNELPKEFLGEEERKNDRSFNEGAMFVKARKVRAGKLGLSSSSSSAPSVAGVGLRAATPNSSSNGSVDTQISVLDLIDIEQFFALRHRLNPGSAVGKAKDGLDVVDAGALSTIGLGSAGAVMMLGTRVLGVHSIVDSVTRTLSFLGSKEAQRLLVPVAVIASAGLGAFIIWDLPRAVPRNVGRRLVLSLESPSPTSSTSPLSPRPSTSTLPNQSFAMIFAGLTQAESRKVLRFAGYDTREKYRVKEEKVGGERREAEKRKGETGRAKEWLEGFKTEVEGTKEGVKGVVLGD